MGLVEILEDFGVQEDDTRKERNKKIARALVQYVNEEGVATSSELASALFQVLRIDLSQTINGRTQRMTTRGKYIEGNQYLREEHIREHGIQYKILFNAVQEYLKGKFPESTETRTEYQDTPHGQKVFYIEQEQLQQYLSERLEPKRPVVEYKFVEASDG